jgi:hypothetical protein
VGERVHRREEGLSSPFKSSLATAAYAANIDVPRGEEVSADEVIDKENREPPHPLGLVMILWRSGIQCVRQKFGFCRWRAEN